MHVSYSYVEPIKTDVKLPRGGEGVCFHLLLHLVVTEHARSGGEHNATDSKNITDN